MSRFAMRIDPIWRPLLGVFGGMRDASFAEVKEGHLRFRFGLLFDHDVPLGDVISAEKRASQFWDGIGWRLNPLTRTVKLLGSHEGVVELKLRKSSRTWGLFPFTRISMSLTDPEAFLAAVQDAQTKQP
ncbi:MAG: hypothetical protein ABI559_07445 [Chloroflexota bacterium]